MRIGIYAETAKGAKPTGIGRHVQNLVRALAELDSDNEYLLYCARPALGRCEGWPEVPRQANFRLRSVRVPSRWQWNRPRVWWDWYLPQVLRADRLDVFHGPNHFLPKYDSRRCIVTIHDLAYYRMPVHGPGKDALMRHWTTLALQRAGRVIALSENTRGDVEGLGVPADRIRVVYGGGHVVSEGRIEYGRVAELRERLNLHDRYVLFVGALQPRKNVPFLVRAFARLKHATALPHKLVLAGPPEAATEREVRDLTVQLGIQGDVLIPGYVDDWQIPLLYKQADVFALPTRYEGFTLVTLEAMAYGTPVVATDTSSIREGVGDAALLVPEDDVDALAAALRRAIEDQPTRELLIGRGKRQAAQFTWQRCAEQTIDVYHELCNGRKGARVA
jgi:glycosyltransferase involved in cell wall biosynthesis